MEISKIREFIRENLITLEDEVTFKDDDNIFELGLVDSPFAIELVLFIEEEFEIEILDSDLDIENFVSVECIAEFIKRKKGI